MQLLEALRDPAPEFTPFPFWFLNGDLTHKELRRQLADFHAHGVDGVVLHPRMGLSKRIGYLSETFFSYIRTALETCRELGMRVILYDEGMYPSGSACGQVVKGHPEFASIGITVTDAPEAGDEILAERDGRSLVARFTRGTIRGVHYGEDDGEPNAPASADLLNPDAAARFIELTHEAYYGHFREYFGSTVIGFFTDEPSITGRCVRNMRPWTRGFTGIFTNAGGNLQNLFALFDGETNDDTRLYERMIMERENDVYYSALSAWCREHGISLMGHPDASDDIERERHFHIPGQDLIYRQVAPEKGDLTGRDSVQGKCSADAARLLGRRRNLSECLGVCGDEKNPWSMTAGDMKWFIDYLAVRGVNLYILHAFYYSIRGARKGERPPDVGPHSIWWPHYEKWANYIKRISCLMTNTVLHAPVAVLCRNRELMPEAVAPLFENQIGFLYLPQSFWDDCREENGQLVCKDMCFSAVIDPENRFPGVSRDIMGAGRDILCEKPQPALRSIRFRRFGTECVFLTNTGETNIDTGVELPFDGPAGQFDLWSGEVRRFDRQPGLRDGEDNRFDRRPGLQDDEDNRLDRRPGLRNNKAGWLDEQSGLRDDEDNRLDGQLGLRDGEAGWLDEQSGLRDDEDNRLDGQPGLRDGEAGWLDEQSGLRDNEASRLDEQPAPRDDKAGRLDEQPGLRNDETGRFDRRLILPRRGSLLIFACTEQEFFELPKSTECSRPHMETPTFVIEQQDPKNAVITYTALLPRGEGGVITLEAEEMAELSVNGIPSGVSFWAPHTFDLTGLLTEDANLLRLTVTGSRANLYGEKVPYGLIEN